MNKKAPKIIYRKIKNCLMEKSTSKLLKKYWWVLVLILMPAIINLSYHIHIPYLDWLNKYFDIPQKWTEYWGTYLSTLASSAMVIITWITLKQNRIQLDEMKQQWDKENKPQLEMYFVKDEIPVKGQRIEIVNIGKNTAKDIKFCIDENIIEKAPNNDTKEALKNIGQSFSLSLLPNDSVIISLCEDNTNEQYKHNYKIGLESVNKEEYLAFYNSIESMKNISIEVNYNSKYKNNITISPNIKRNKHKDIADALADIGECIKRLDLMIERKLDTKDNKTNNTIS